MPYRSFVLAVVTSFLLFACGGSRAGTTSDAGPQLPEACGEYLARYEACLSRDNPAAQQAVAKKRAEAVRLSLLSELSDAHDPSRIAERCTTSLSRLQDVCR